MADDIASDPGADAVAAALNDLVDLPAGASLPAWIAAPDRRDLAPGETLIAQGDPSDAMYVVVSGRLVAERDGAVLGTIRPGETVGEMGVVTGEPRTASVRAVRSSTVARLPRGALERLVAETPGLGLAVARTLVGRQKRAAAPRHPVVPPGSLCIVAGAGIDAPALIHALAQAGAPFERLEPGSDLRARIDAVERAGRVAVTVAGDGDDALLRDADAVVVAAHAGADAVPGPVERRLGEVPDRMLLLLRPADAPSPSGTARWLAGRADARVVHLRLGHAGDLRRAARLLTGRGVGIVLAGGGARGAAHLGALAALAERGIEPDIVGGSSIGAALGALYAAGLRGDALVAEARAIFVTEGSPTSDWTALPLISLVKGNKTRRLARASIRRIIGETAGIEDLRHPFFAVAADLTHQRQTVLRRGPLVRALAATYAIPGVLPPVPIDGALHVDGGVVNNLPVDVMEREGAAHIIAVDLLGDGARLVDLDAMPTGAQMLRDRLRPRARRRYRVPGVMTTLMTATVLGSLDRQRAMRARADLLLRPDLPRVGFLSWHRFDDAIAMGHASCAAQLDAADPALLAGLRT